MRCSVTALCAHSPLRCIVPLCAQDTGITHLWLPPPSMSVSDQGYLPGQLYNLDASKYGTLAELKVLRQAARRGEEGGGQPAARAPWRTLPVHPCTRRTQRPVQCHIMQDLVSAANKLGISVIADIVINHRCADEMTDGVYNQFRDDVTHDVRAGLVWCLRKRLQLFQSSGSAHRRSAGCPPSRCALVINPRTTESAAHRASGSTGASGQ